MCAKIVIRLEVLPKVCALAFSFSTAHVQRAALHCAQRCTARSITQRPALHYTEHSEPRQGRSQQANQAYTARSATQCPALHSAQRYTALHSATQRPALHCAQRYTAPSVAQCAALYSPPLQRCTARSIAQRPALHCTEHSEPRQGRSQHANQAYTSGGIFQSAFNGCCAQTVRVRVSLPNSRTRAFVFPR